ncbi:FAD-dependent oxidoreductase [Desulfopila sp. IMCC35006]|nr:FAD-dependent oxidoreductase [Desulfopila sp. IMCC35006]
MEGEPGSFTAKIHQTPRYVDPLKCTSCGECAKVCPVSVPNEYNERLDFRKAIYKQYPQAIPGSFSINKEGTAPCKATCPAHVSIQGFVALINDGRHDEALKLFKEEHPFPGICGRVCHHPCESECTRAQVDQSLAVRELHRFLGDYELEKGELYIPAPRVAKRSEKIAVIGSGPAGVTAAYALLRQGYHVTIFEKQDETGGMMRYGIPEYRLPRNILASEIKVVEKMGAEIKCGVTFGKDITLESLKADGYSAAFLAIGLHSGRKLGIENEDIAGVLQGVDFLRDAAKGKKIEVGKEVVVVGGGNVAVDVAETAKRLGAEKVTLICLERREEMPAWEYEITEALEDDIEIVNSFGPRNLFLDNSTKKISGIEFKSCTQVFDANGRFNPAYDESVCQTFNADTLIIAIGQSANLEGFADQGIAISRPGGLEADPVTLQTPIDWVFAGGDAFYGPKSVVDAVACGKEAAISIDRFINNMDLKEGREKVWEYVRPAIEGEGVIERIKAEHLAPEARAGNFLEVAYGFNEEMAQKEAHRCMSCGICSECYQCLDACLAGAIDHSQAAVDKDLAVGSVILATGAKPYDPTPLSDIYLYKKNPNVVTSLEFERLLSSGGPCLGHLVRPSDHEEPKKIAWLQCIGSRDNNKCGNSYCSSVCCMYAIKDAMIAKEHAGGDLDAAIFYMDIRSFGKDYEEYYNRARNREGIRFVQSRIHSVTENPKNRNLVLRFSNEDGVMMEEEFDMLVLSVGLEVPAETIELAKKLEINVNKNKFIESEPFAPLASSRPGIFTCGTFQGPKDIPASVTEASAAAGLAGCVIAEARGTDTKTVEIPEEIDISGQEPRVGVFVCNCGSNIAGVVDVPALQEYAKSLPGVVFTDNNLFTCSQDTQAKIKDKILEEKLNRVVVASCSPKTHAPMFMETLEACGLNRYLFEMANIRNQDSWVHAYNPELATEKAKDLVRMAVARAVQLKPLHGKVIPVNKHALVVGGGIAGMNAALDLSRQGFSSTLLEKQGELGGMGLKLHHTIEGADVRTYVDQLASAVKSDEKITVLTNSQIARFEGFQGNFKTMVRAGGLAEPQEIEHGVIIVASGAKEYTPKEFLYGEDDRVLTQTQLGDRLAEKGASDLDSVVMIQCVGSRNDERPNCSRICCQSAVKNALAIKKSSPDTQVFILYRDMRLYGQMEDYYTEARKQGVIFVRYYKENPPVAKASDEGVLVTVRDHILQRDVEICADVLVLSAGVVPNISDELTSKMKLNANPEGYFLEAHVKLRPVDMGTDAVFLCGTAHGPKLISEAIVQANAAAARAVTFLSKDEIKLSAIKAEVFPDHCVKCLTCVRSCPFEVPQFNVAAGEIQIDPALCQGCGVCACVCPRQAINLNNYEDNQITCEIETLLAEGI